MFACRYILGLNIKFERFDMLPMAMPTILAPKHASFMDAISLYSLNMGLTFILGKSTADKPIFRRIVPKLKIIVCDEFGGAKALKQLALDAQALPMEKRRFVIYPEGNWSIGDERHDYKIGVFFLQRKILCDVYPIASDLGKFWPRNTKDRKSGISISRLLFPLEVGMTKGVFMMTLARSIEDKTLELWQRDGSSGQIYTRKVGISFQE